MPETRWPTVKPSTTMSERRVAIDTSVLVGLINPTDVWHARAVALRDAMHTHETAVILFDCVIAEAVSIVVRRLHEKKRGDDVARLLAQAKSVYPPTAVSWILPTVPQRYAETLALMKQSGGALNFHDALIALVCRDEEIPAIASFDADFDALPWLTRCATPEDLAHVA